jgi:hypothetical protein
MTSLKSIAFAAMAWLLSVPLASVQGTSVPDKETQGSVKFRSDYFWVDKDKGRFREDQWRTDENGYTWQLQGRALYEHDYGLSLLMTKKDSHYLLLDFMRWRRYFDGSNEAWDASVPSLAEKTDSDFFVDHDTYNIEFGLTPEQGLTFILGWERLVKDGQEVLLRGADGISA